MKNLKTHQLHRTTLSSIKGGSFTATDDLAKWRKNIEDGIIDRRSSSASTRKS